MNGKIENHSQGEAQFAKDLYLELKAGKYKNVSEQVKIPLQVNIHFICFIIVDFFVEHDTYIEIIEYKSKPTKTAAWKIKWKLLQALYPEYKYTIVDHAD